MHAILWIAYFTFSVSFKCCLFSCVICFSLSVPNRQDAHSEQMHSKAKWCKHSMICSFLIRIRYIQVHRIFNWKMLAYRRISNIQCMSFVLGKLDINHEKKSLNIHWQKNWLNVEISINKIPMTVGDYNWKWQSEWTNVQMTDAMKKWMNDYCNDWCNEHSLTKTK